MKKSVKSTNNALKNESKKTNQPLLMKTNMMFEISGVIPQHRKVVFTLINHLTTVFTVLVVAGLRSLALL